MITSRTPLAWYVVVTGMGACVRAALPDTLGGVPAGLRECFSVPGSIAWDDCQCGQLALSVGPSYYSTTFPQPENVRRSLAGCGAPYWVAPVTVTMLRCAPTPTGTDLGPSCAALAQASMILESDRQVITQALACCLQGWVTDRTIADYVIGPQAPVGPDGGCVGIALTVTVGISNCACPGT